jgi:hypothetical protein
VTLKLVDTDHTVAMQLPEGKTCTECRNIARCLAFGFTEAKNTSCDFFPNRFKEATKK